MALPHKIATLLYAFDAEDRVLLLQRAREPNLGLWSPPGGKLHTAEGESPHACACREAAEELGLALAPGDLRLAGLVSERGYEGTAHWLMFLFEIRPRLTTLPPPIGEGRFAFFARDEMDSLALPATDRDWIWPMFWKHRKGFFAAFCDCSDAAHPRWTIEEVRGGLTGPESPQNS